MSVTLVAVLCHQLNSVSLCIEEPIPTPQMAAGKADDPVTIPFTKHFCEIDGIPIILDWIRDPLNKYHDWTLRAYKCVPGEYVPTKRA